MNDNSKSEIAFYMKRLYDKGLTTSSGGNLSIRAGFSLFFITPSGKDKGRLEEDDICVCDANGNSRNPKAKLSIETPMHLAIYNIRKDVSAIVHAHPPYSTAFSINHRLPDTGLSGEMRAILGTPVLVDYSCMGSAELAKTTASASENSNVILLKNHGAITLGKTLFEAFDRMEVLEAASKISFISGLLGNTKFLSEEQLKEIDRVFNKHSHDTNL